MSVSDEQPDDDELRQRFVESLLISVGEQQDHSARIRRAMNALPVSVAATESPTGRSWRGLRWAVTTLTVCVALALGLMLPAGGSSPALVAVERSLKVAAEKMTRRYQLQVDARTLLGTSRTIDNDLYVQGHDRFALRHPGLLPGRDTWLGRRGDESWVVPAAGPVLQGDRTVLSRWLSERGEPDTPYLHVSTILSRMNTRGFQLQLLQDESVQLPDGSTVLCQHIQAQQTSPIARELPVTIKLWASRATGMAIRLTARWDLPPGEPGRKSVVLTYLSDEPSLSAEWFTPQAHQRSRLRK